MRHKIDIDDEIWNLLKNHAQPFEDTPNSVLRRLLISGNSKKTHSIGSEKIITSPNFPSGLPTALQQILEVIYLVVKQGYTRNDATNFVAKRRDVFPQTVIDKYCRQLNKKAYEIDILIEQNLTAFKALLQNNFGNHKTYIETFFKEL